MVILRYCSHHMEDSLPNDDLIRKLCSQCDGFMFRDQPPSPDRPTAGLSGDAGQQGSDQVHVFLLSTLLKENPQSFHMPTFCRFISVFSEFLTRSGQKSKLFQVFSVRKLFFPQLFKKIIW